MLSTAPPPSLVPPLLGTRIDVPVEEVMTPGVVTVMEDTPLVQLGRALVHHGIDGVLVVGRRSGTPLGWVTARGLLDHLGDDPWLRRAVDVISEQPNVIHPAASVAQAATRLSAPGVSRLLVSDDTRRSSEGVVTARDIVRAAL
jgi:CBS domain-containing protein